MNRPTALLDQDTRPTVRETIVRLLTHAQSADLAIANVRLGAIDLSEAEVGSMAQTRLLLARLDSASLACEPQQLARLHGLATAGRLQVRCAGLNNWSPDFSLYHGLPGETHACLLLGAHYFRAMFAHGTAFTACIADPGVVTRTGQRFESLWTAGYDVLPAITESLEQSLRASA